MKFTIERAYFLKTLSHMQSIVEKRNTIPVLSNVRIEAKGNVISFKATDMDIEITELVEAKIAEEGATTAPAHMLYDIVRTGHMMPTENPHMIQPASATTALCDKDAII